ncbi:MAG TPA: D-aminoacyl-tRNA deacylase [Acidimicrobiales bacterium]|nr:D-aminoacyl-tRNA deacylase [Acidimicrobiales bacterium]
MRAVVQRVRGAEVRVDDAIVGAIDGVGLCVLVGVGRDDTKVEAAAIADKLWRVRIFDDEDGRMNLAAADLDAPVLLISQFTLYGDTSRGRRPSWAAAAAADHAAALIDELTSELRALGAEVATGRFGADMQVALTNDGPVTLLLDV